MGLVMSRSSFFVRIARVVQGLPLQCLQFLEWPFFLLREKATRSGEVFILALPRSGSTVTYQVLAHGLNAYYLSNVWNLLYRLPLLGGFFSGFLSRQYVSDFKSEHGFVKGLSGPSEGMGFWKWWLDCGLSDSDCLSFSEYKVSRRARYLRRVIGLLTRNYGVFCSAYLGHTLVPERLRKHFPNAVFIRLRRRPLDNALSLLSSMRNSGVKWFSLMPSECLEWELASDCERVAAQVYWLNRRLDKFFNPDFCLDVDYESLCINPSYELSRVYDFCLSKGVLVKIENELPAAFQRREVNHGDADARAVEAALCNLETKYGKLRNGC